MSVQRKIKKTQQPVPKSPPVVIVPDKSYVDDTGHLIPTELIVLTHAEYYGKFISCLYENAKHKTKTSVQRVRTRKHVKSK
ncbi:hypothetical protein KAR91_05380 [Candidatus Pacearchaeota archaeon]|nr:hypothetical protein [Candidatus Pacearchaeota archaeon]